MSEEKIPGRNPPEPVERRPESTPAPPLAEQLLCSMCWKPLTYMGKFRGQPIYGHKTFEECAGNIIEQIRAKLERIPCMSEYCEGIEDGQPAFKHRPVTVRCHRCAAMRLAKSVLTKEAR